MKTIDTSNKNKDVRTCNVPESQVWICHTCLACEGPCVKRNAREEASASSNMPAPPNCNGECKGCPSEFKCCPLGADFCVGNQTCLGDCEGCKEVYAKTEASASPHPSPLCPVCGTAPEYVYPFQVAGNPPETVELGHCAKCDKDFEL